MYKLCTNVADFLETTKLFYSHSMVAGGFEEMS